MKTNAGLCETCRHSSCIPHPRGGQDYWRCLLAEIDPRFSRYPRLPVKECAGYEPKENTPKQA